MCTDSCIALSMAGNRSKSAIDSLLCTSHSCILTVAAAPHPTSKPALALVFFPCSLNAMMVITDGSDSKQFAPDSEEERLSQSEEERVCQLMAITDGSDSEQFASDSEEERLSELPPCYYAGGKVLYFSQSVPWIELAEARCLLYDIFIYLLCSNRSRRYNLLMFRHWNFMFELRLGHPCLCCG